MIGMDHPIQAAIQKASQAQRGFMAVADATATMEEARTKAIEEAASKGEPVFIPRVFPKRMDGSERFPTVLARLLCERPEKAKLSNDALMQEVSDLLALDASLKGNCMSKPLSAAALNHVKRVLAEFGFDGSGIRKGTDIKRLVKGGTKVKGGASRSKKLTTEFVADGVVLDGRKYQYRQRERSPMGNAWHDFVIRIAGQDVSLAAALALRKIGIQEFMDADEVAIVKGTPEAIAKRQSIDRPHKASNSHRRCPRCSGKLSETVPRVLARELVQAWWLDHSDVGQGSDGLRAMLRYFSEIEDDPVAIEQARKNITSWGERTEHGVAIEHAVTP